MEAARVGYQGGNGRHDAVDLDCQLLPGSTPGVEEVRARHWRHRHGHLAGRTLKQRSRFFAVPDTHDVEHVAWAGRIAIGACHTRIAVVVTTPLGPPTGGVGNLGVDELATSN